MPKLFVKGDIMITLLERANNLRERMQLQRRDAIKKYYSTRDYKVLEGEIN